MSNLFQSLFFSAILFLPFVNAAYAVEELVVKIGHVAALTGPNAASGKENENGARLAIEELNNKGVFIQGKKVKFQLIPQDDAGDPKQGTLVAQILVDAKVDGVIGHMNSGTTIPAAKIYFQAGIPQISPSATSTTYTAMGFNTAFQLMPNDDKVADELALYTIKNLKAKKIAIIDDRTSYGEGLASQFMKAVKNQNQAIQFAPRQFTTDKATDFTSILTTLKAAKPDTIFYGGTYGVAGPMLRQMHSLGLKANFVAGDGVCLDVLSELAGDSISHTHIICSLGGGVPHSREKSFDAFKAAYKKRFNLDVQSYAPYAYDAVMVMAEAMKRANSADSSVYLPFLQKIHYQGLTGEITFDSRGNLKDGYISLYTFNHGKRELIGSNKDL